MNTLMWEHPITSEHVERLIKLGYTHVPPIKKTLACKDTGEIQTITREQIYLLRDKWHSVKKCTFVSCLLCSFGLLIRKLVKPLKEILTYSV